MPTYMLTLVVAYLSLPIPITAYLGRNPAAQALREHAARRNPAALYEPHYRRNIGGSLLVSSGPPTSEASGALSLDPTYECTPYNYGPILKLKPSYPTEWETATIQSNDSEAQSIFARVNASLSRVLPDDLLHPSNGHLGAWTPAAEAYNHSDPDCWWTWSGCTKPNPSLGIPEDLVSVPEPNTWGLAFDDGPNCSHNAFYDYLQDHNMKASLFYIGSNVFNWPLQAMRGLADGHHICCHTWSHQYMTSFTNEEVFAELWYSRKILQDILNITVTCWRPPFGDIDNRVRYIAKELNLTTFMWDHDTEDWKVNISGVTPQDIYDNYANVVERAKNGSFDSHGTITLAHELTNFTMSTFIKESPSIVQAFQHVVPLASAFNWTHPYAGSEIVYPTFDEYISGNGSSSAKSSNVTAAKTNAPGSSSKAVNLKGSGEMSSSRFCPAVMLLIGITVAAINVSL